MHLRECCETGMGLPGGNGAPQRRWVMTLSLILPLAQIFPKSPVWAGQPPIIQGGYSDQVAGNFSTVLQW
jgi:hypothetical protein